MNRPFKLFLLVAVVFLAACASQMPRAEAPNTRGDRDFRQIKVSSEKIAVSLLLKEGEYAWFRYGVDPNVSGPKSSATIGPGPGETTVEIAGLRPCTRYYLQLFREVPEKAAAAGKVWEIRTTPPAFLAGQAPTTCR